MTIQYEYKLTKLKKVSSDNLNDVVVQTYWTYTGTDENLNTGVFTGATPFDINTVDPNNFTPYENLTEAQVLGWIEQVVESNPVYKAHILGRIQEQIDEKTNPPVETQKFPWDPPVEE